MVSATTRTFVSLGTAIAFALMVSACGTTPGDRAVSGGLLGAGTGAAIGAAAGSVGKGALIGGLGGAAIGLLTTPGMLNLGEPPWHYAHGGYHRRYACNTHWSHAGGETTKTTVCHHVA